MRCGMLVIVMLVLIGGCQAARVEQPLTCTLGADDPDAQSDSGISLPSGQSPVTTMHSTACCFISTAATRTPTTRRAFGQ